MSLVMTTSVETLGSKRSPFNQVPATWYHIPFHLPYDYWSWQCRGSFLSGTDPPARTRRLNRDTWWLPTLCPQQDGDFLVTPLLPNVDDIGTFEPSKYMSRRAYYYFAGPSSNATRRGKIDDYTIYDSNLTPAQNLLTLQILFQKAEMKVYEVIFSSPEMANNEALVKQFISKSTIGENLLLTRNKLIAFLISSNLLESSDDPPFPILHLHPDIHNKRLEWNGRTMARQPNRKIGQSSWL